MSPEPGAQDVAERREQAASLIRRLLGENASHRREKTEGGRTSEIWEAKEWNPNVPAEQRAGLISQAKAAWPGRVTMSGSPSQSQPQSRPKAKSHVNRKAASKAVAANVSSAMLGDNPSLAFDGSRSAPAAAAMLAREELRDAPSSAYTPAAALASRAGTPASIARRATPPPAPRAPKRADGTEDARPYAELIARQAEAAGLKDPSMIHALIAATGGNYSARRRSGDAYGLMLVTRDAANWVGVKGDLRDPEVNVRAGAMIYAKLLKMFDGDEARAAAAYRAGAHAVIESGGIPNRRDVKEFVGDFEKAYRGTSLPKPPVAAVTAPTVPNVRQAVEQAKADAGGTPEAPRSHFSRAKPWAKLIAKASATFGVDPALIESVLMEESQGHSHTVSPVGAVGLMQLMPGTARSLGVKNSYDPEQNVMGGAKYMRDLLKQFHGDKVLAVAAYNAGPNRAALRAGHVPAFHETVNYVTRVFMRYQMLTGQSIDTVSYMTGRGRTWAVKEAHRMARLMGAPVPEDAPGPVTIPTLPPAGVQTGGSRPVSQPGPGAPSASLPDYPASGGSADPVAAGGAAPVSGGAAAEVTADPRRGRSTGQPWNGRLKDGERLPPQGVGYHSIREGRGRFYGLGRLVAGVEWVGEQLHAKDPSAPVLAMGDLSAKNGGSVSGHRSHQNGHDADFVLFWTDAQGHPIPTEEFVRLTPHGTSTYNGKQIKFDVERNWQLASLIATNPYFKPQMVFLDQPLIDALLKYAQRSGQDKAVISKVSEMLEAWPHHSDHMHVRIQ